MDNYFYKHIGHNFKRLVGVIAFGLQNELKIRESFDPTALFNFPTQYTLNIANTYTINGEWYSMEHTSNTRPTYELH